MSIQVNPIALSSFREVATTSQSKVRGFSENSLSAIAYLTILPAIFLLAVAPKNKNSIVRFHTRQSVLFHLAVLIITYALGIALRFEPFAYVILSYCFWIACAFAWSWCVAKALKGERLKLPIIGAWAERTASKLPARMAVASQHSTP